MDLQTILRAVRAIGPAMNAVREIREIIDFAVASLSEDDQAEAKAQLATLRARSDALHARAEKSLGG